MQRYILIEPASRSSVSVCLSCYNSHFPHGGLVCHIQMWA